MNKLNLRSLLVVLMFVITSSVQGRQEHRGLQETTLDNVSQIKLLDSVQIAPIREIAWSPNDHIVAVATSEGLWTYHLNSGTLERKVNHAVDQVSFISPENVLINTENQAIIINTYTLEILNEFPTGFNSVSHDNTMYSVANSNGVTIYDLQTGLAISEILVEYVEPCEYACIAQDVVFNSADTSIAFSYAVPEMQSKIVEIETGDTLLINIGMSGLTFNPNDDLIVSRVGELGFLSHQTYITSVLDGQLIATINLFGSYTPPIFDRRGDLLVVEGVDNNAPNVDEAENWILFFDLGELIDQVKTDTSYAVNTIVRDSEVTALSFSPDYQILAVGEADGDLSLWGVPID